jgi:aspartyl-tRNA(Asn)/glutamyl-tRNA(Gln) amidotransferase subunit A
MCAITGMKPTYGLVSRRGVFPLAYSLDHVGPMTRTVRDNAILLQVIAGPDDGDPASACQPIPDYSADLDRGVKGLRIGLIRHFYTNDDTADPEVSAGIEAAADVLRHLGAELVEISLPKASDFAACCRLILRAEAFAIHRNWLVERPGDYGEIARNRLMDGAGVSAADYIDAQRLRSRLIRATQQAFESIDVALTASSLDPPCRIDDAEACARAYPRQARQAFNVTGQPAITIPAGFTKAGLPLSIQLIGHNFQEAMVYRVAAAYEAAARWVEQHPPGLQDAHTSVVA